MTNLQSSSIRVVALRYKVVPSEGFFFKDPPSIGFESEVATMALADGKLVCTLKEDFSSVEPALEVVAPVLRAWEVSAALEEGRQSIRFEFESPDIQDRTPPPPGVVNAYAYARGVAAGSAAGTVTFHRECTEYPSPPDAFRLSPDVESAFLRYKGYREGREPLPGMAYFILTLVEKGMTRGQAAVHHRIDVTVLRKLGEFTSTRGNFLTARKAVVSSDLTSQETEWVEAAIKVLIRRLGEAGSSIKLRKITMSDLPII